VINKEKRGAPETDFDKEAFQEALFTEIGTAFEMSDLGTPGEESMAYYEKVVAVLPEGKLRSAVEGLRKPAEISAKIADVQAKIEDFIWPWAKKALAAEMPLVLLLPDNINSKLKAGAQRLSGNIGESIIAWGVKMIEQMKNSSENAPAPMMA
jgi:hypothetical protein